MTAKSKWKKIVEQFRCSFRLRWRYQESSLCAWCLHSFNGFRFFSPLYKRAPSPSSRILWNVIYYSSLIPLPPFQSYSRSPHALGKEKLLTFFIPFMLHVEFLFSSIPCRRAGNRNVHNVNILLIEMMNWISSLFLSFSHAMWATDFFVCAIPLGLAAFLFAEKDSLCKLIEIQA